MEKTAKKDLFSAIICLILFVGFTLIVKFADVSAIGPMNSRVGLACLNGLVDSKLIFNSQMYIISELIGYACIAIVALFAITGLVQLIKGRGFKGVDSAILLLGLFYLILAVCYILFDKVFIINFRPLLENTELDPSYPSSHVLLVLCVCITAKLQVERLFKNGFLSFLTRLILTIAMLGEVVTRLLSGVHWTTDIVGAILLSSFLCSLYFFFVSLTEVKQNNV